MASGYQVLTADQAEQFLDKGFVVVRGCFSADTAAEFTRGIWTRLGYDQHDQSTWSKSSVHMPAHRRLDVREFAPKAWQAVCDLVGGAERISADWPYTWDDGFIVNLWHGADRPWSPPSSEADLHKDGDFFRHFLDSPEQGLLTFVLWSDVRHQGGATLVATDSVRPVARFLADHPEGAHPQPHDPPEGQERTIVIPYADLAKQCEDFIEATGEAGDVYLIHPFVLHSKAQNMLRVPRFITNPPLSLAEPMRFDRADPDDFSLVELAVLRALGVDRYEFAPTRPRELLVPLRVAHQRQMKLEEEQRLAATGQGPST